MLARLPVSVLGLFHLRAVGHLAGNERAACTITFPLSARTVIVTTVYVAMVLTIITGISAGGAYFGCPALLWLPGATLTASVTAYAASFVGYPRLAGCPKPPNALRVGQLCGAGTATALSIDLCRTADEHGWTLCATPRTARLARIYPRFGFTRYHDGPHMVRVPAVPCPTLRPAGQTDR